MTGKPDDKVFLETARLGERNRILIEYDEKAQFPRMRRRFRSYAQVDLAHAVMLVERGILPADGGSRLVAGLMRILELGPDRFPWLPNSGSYLVHAEHFLGETVGEDVAGLLQTGRSRNDQSAAAERLFQRNLLLDIAEALLPLVETTLDQAERHADTLMPGYTHLQHAQPWTFGHYLMRQASILGRDLDRLSDAYRRTNLSALGGAANAGTSWPIDRQRIAALLGHDGLVVNACDAGGFARDFIEENTACLAILAANLGRFATDLYVWHSWEFGYVEIADGLAGTSSIMPQKKNPHALERVKAVAGQAIGWLATVMGNQRSVLSTDLDYAFGDDLFGGYVEAAYGALRLMHESVASLIVRPERMAASAGAFWSTTSHLADELVRRHGLPFRTAHQIVARFVRAAIEAGQAPDAVTAAPLVAAAREIAGLDLAMDDAELRRVLGARHFVETRVSEGSVAPAEVRRHAAAVRAELAERRRLVAQRRGAAESAIAGLDAAARAIAARTAAR